MQLLFITRHLVDIFLKSLLTNKFEILRTKLGVCNLKKKSVLVVQDYYFFYYLFIFLINKSQFHIFLRIKQIIIEFVINVTYIVCCKLCDSFKIANSSNSFYFLRKIKENSGKVTKGQVSFVFFSFIFLEKIEENSNKVTERQIVLKVLLTAISNESRTSLRNF